MPCARCGKPIIEPVKLHPVHICVCQECGELIERSLRCELCGQDLPSRKVADALEGEA